MPLDPSKITGSPGVPGAGNRDYPTTGTACGTEWADALGAYAAAIVPPSTTVTAATATLKTALQAAFNNPDQSARLPAAVTAMTTWATAIGGGMAGYVATPPVGSPFTLLLAAPSPPTTRAAGCTLAASSIDTWMRTGIATLVAPPFTATPWS